MDGSSRGVSGCLTPPDRHTPYKIICFHPDSDLSFLVQFCTFGYVIYSASIFGAGRTRLI